jgi:hypothetical protein
MNNTRFHHEAGNLFATIQTEVSGLFVELDVKLEIPTADETLTIERVRVSEESEVRISQEKAEIIAQEEMSVGNWTQAQLDRTLDKLADWKEIWSVDAE